MKKARNSFKAADIITNSSLRESTSLVRRSNSLSTCRVGDNEATIHKQLSESDISMKKKEDQISEIVVTIDTYLQKKTPTHRSVTKSRKICRVPNNLRELHTQSFDPRLISIGPFHRHKEHLIPMEEHKWRLLSNLLTNMNNPGDQYQNGTSAPSTVVLESVVGQHQFEPANTNSIRCLVAAMKELEANARACYSETFDDFGPNEFIMMMLLDGCFVVKLLRLYAKFERKDVHDPIFSSRLMLPNLQHDLVMFENQLPFDVIEKIFDITGSSDKESHSLADLTLMFFDPLLPKKRVVSNECIVDIKPHHMLGLFRSSFLLCLELHRIIPSSLTKQWQLKHCVTELKEAGIVFKKRENFNLLDIKFKNGNLYIPSLFVDDHTGTVFLNFVAYEQCNRYTKPYFTHYLSFLDSLVNSSKDVEHLQNKGIIDHSLGCEEDVADLFNKLCREVAYDVNDCYLSETMKEVNQYCSMRRHKWCAKWKHDYFSTPWAFTSFLAAIFLLILTSIQAFFAVLAYIHPPS